MEYFSKQLVSNHASIIEEEEEEEEGGEDDEVSSVESLENDFTEQVLDSSASSISASSPNNNQQHQKPVVKDPLDHMSSDLLQQLPFKRGLSKHYQGKSQSFTSLSNVRCLEDLAKPENPYKKRLKYCKSYAEISESYKQPSPPKCFSSKPITRKDSKISCSSPTSKRSTNGSFLGAKPPIHPHSSPSGNSFSGKTALFA